MKITKNKHIRMMITWLISFGLVFAISFCLILGRPFELNTFYVLIGFLLGSLLIIWLICLFLILTEKKYYIIKKDSITLWCEGEKICELKTEDIIEIKYIGFRYVFLMQMGSGYLNIKCPVTSLTEKKFASLVMPDGTAIFEISMSKKQAKSVSKILAKNIYL